MVSIAVRLTPRAARTRVLGAATDDAGRRYLKVAVAAPPVDGAANAALLAYLAERWAVPKSALRLAAGETARLKRIELTADPEACARAAADQGTGTS